MGEIEVPADRDWGAHRQRSLVHFSGRQRPPNRLILVNINRALLRRSKWHIG
jgi:fumarate hydratase class II